MGNRAVVVFHEPKSKTISPAIYLHWNGGPESIYAFLDELRRRRVSDTVETVAARFAHVVGDFFDSDEATSSSLAVMNGPAEIAAESLTELAYTADDNGVYTVELGQKWTVRRFVVDHYDLPARELSKREVAREREAAYQHPNHTGELNESGGGGSIAAQFLKMRPKVSKHG